MKFPQNQKRSFELAKVVGAKKQQCWKNSFLTLPYVEQGAVYVEGLAMTVVLPIPLDHGWVELQDGSVIDVTWCHLDEVVYHPIRKYTIDEVLHELEVGKMELPIIGQPGRMTSNEMMEHLSAIMAMLED